MAKVNHKEATGEHVESEAEKHTALAEVNGAAAVAQYDEDDFGDSGAGFEDVKASDLSLPFWRLLQSLSPETKRSQPEYIDGAAEGMWLDTTTQELFDEILFVPSRFRTEYIEWHTVKDGRGFVANHGQIQEVVEGANGVRTVGPAALLQAVQDKETGALMLPAGTELVPTSTWYGVVVGGRYAGEAEFTMDFCRPAVISMTKTATKTSRKWLRDARGLIRLNPSTGHKEQAPIWHATWLIGSAPMSNARGSWATPKVARGALRSSLSNAREVLESARAFYEMTKERFATPKTDEGEADMENGPKVPF